MTKPRAGFLPTSRRAGTLALLPALVVLSLLSGCAPSPTTTYLDSNGTEVTVDWADYPGSPGITATDVLSAPPKEQIEQVEAELAAEIKQALAAELDFDLDWRTDGEARWNPNGGNGYGGESAYVTFNSRDHVADYTPAGADDWPRIIEIVSTITASRGMGPVELDHERADADAESLREQFGTDDPDEYWQWVGSAYGSSQWIVIALTDVDRDGSGEAAEQWNNADWPARGLTISYGATTLPAGERAEFERRLAPFSGLVAPPTTTSD